jgi:hypothetical protein
MFLRLGRTDSAPEYGAFLALQNPFLKWDRKDRQDPMAYLPDLEWRANSRDCFSRTLRPSSRANGLT